MQSQLGYIGWDFSMLSGMGVYLTDFSENLASLPPINLLTSHQ